MEILPPGEDCRTFTCNIWYLLSLAPFQASEVASSLLMLDPYKVNCTPREVLALSAHKFYRWQSMKTRWHLIKVFHDILKRQSDNLLFVRRYTTGFLRWFTEERGYPLFMILIFREVSWSCTLHWWFLIRIFLAYSFRIRMLVLFGEFARRYEGAHSARRHTSQKYDSKSSPCFPDLSCVFWIKYIRCHNLRGLTIFKTFVARLWKITQNSSEIYYPEPLHLFDTGVSIDLVEDAYPDCRYPNRSHHSTAISGLDQIPLWRFITKWKASLPFNFLRKQKQIKKGIDRSHSRMWLFLNLFRFPQLLLGELFHPDYA